MTDNPKTTDRPDDDSTSADVQEVRESDIREDTETAEESDFQLRTSEQTQAVSDEILISRLESLIFVSPTPITVRRLARILSIDGKKVRELIGLIDDHYENRGIVVQEVSGGFQFRSHPDNAAVIRHVFKLKPLRISRAAMETLSIVAYRQPLTRSEVESIRGVDCGGTLKYLFEKGLVRVIGRKEEPGRPIIYATSKEFLELFSLKALSDLPALHEFHELWDEHQEIVDDQTPLDEKAESEEEVQSKEEDEALAAAGNAEEDDSKVLAAAGNAEEDDDEPLVSEQGEAAENRHPPEKPDLSDHE
ncbi:MAG: SMC-Scp complex subunit ScpB [Proteobacteria bacterium]|nr:SMC-Scp complex subunit ScpB [Pseudomonadota bacterium]